MSIYVDAILRVTSFEVQRYSGSTWSKTTTYETNQRYRLRMCFHNTTTPTNWYEYPAFLSLPGSTTSDVFVVALNVYFSMAGAKFDRTNAQLLRYNGEIPDFNDAIAPGKYRWFSFGEFTWIAQASPCAQHPLTFQSRHREIMHMSTAPQANLVPA